MALKNMNSGPVGAGPAILGLPVFGLAQITAKGKSMNIEELIAFLLIGAVAGWLSGLITKGGGFGVLGNCIVGVLGAVVGGWLFGVLDISIGSRWVGSLITATAGAVLLLFAMRFVKKS